MAEGAGKSTKAVGWSPKVVGVPEQAWYVLPMSVVAGQRSFLRSPPGFRRKNPLAQYQEAWHLLGKPNCRVFVCTISLGRQWRMDADQFAAVLAIGGGELINFKWSSEVSTVCQRAWSFFVSIGAERSE